ncbi:MAG: alpha/beta hydrolase [Clostridiales bacterium]|jgi:acetyl esterase/lipase|nr:alpha/beta hydrolase [Clostridiales bacterium]
MKTGVFQLTEDPSVTLAYYLNSESSDMPNIKKRPAVIVFPGGGYSFCSDREAEPIAIAYLAEGFNTFVLRYSLNEKSAFPNPLNDAEKAYETVLKRSDEWRVDPEKIAVIGFSAGGHLAAALATMSRVKPAALILAYPCILETTSRVLAMPMPGLEDKVNSATPPTFLFSTAEDGLVPIENTIAFSAALARNSVPFESHIFQRGVHGLSLAKPLTSSGHGFLVDKSAALWLKLSVDWLFKLFGDFEIFD